MDLNSEYLKAITRRQFFRRCGAGMGIAALASLLSDELWVSAARAASAPPLADPLSPHSPHFFGRAKSVIYIHCAGAPSQLDLFDYKPTLNRLNGQECPAELIKGERFAFIRGTPKILGSPHTFRKHGQSGQWMSDLLPNMAKVIDEFCIVKSMKTDQFNHAPAQLFVHTGSQIAGRPSFGSWVTYGLGSENRDLPGFVVLTSGGVGPDGGTSLWSSGFLPTVYQGTQFRSSGDPVLHVSNPDGVNEKVRRQTIDALGDLNKMQLGEVGDPEILTRIQQYELAYRMQTSVPELMEIQNEPKAIQEMYGTTPGQTSLANNCLLARRLIERGVRFVQLYDWGWDTHGSNGGEDLINGLGRKCKQGDQATAALIMDLKQRGLLDSTLVVWGGEFGRTPMNEGRNGSKFMGRDHHPKAFTVLLAGGGIRGGMSYGETDELGYNVVKDHVHVHDLQATILHCLGIDHTKLTYKFQGRDYRLTDVHGEVCHGILA